MKDYDGDYLYLIPLKYKEKQVFYEQINIPTQIRGAFFIDESTDVKIGFDIISPTGKKLFSNKENYAIFVINITEIGRYSIVFNNNIVNNDIRITFTLCTNQNKILKKENLSQTELKLQKLNTFIKRFNVEYKFNRNLHQERYKSIFIYN